MYELTTHERRIYSPRYVERHDAINERVSELSKKSVEELWVVMTEHNVPSSEVFNYINNIDQSTLTHDNLRDLIIAEEFCSVDDRKKIYPAFFSCIENRGKAQGDMYEVEELCPSIVSLQQQCGIRPLFYNARFDDCRDKDGRLQAFMGEIMSDSSDGKLARLITGDSSSGKTWAGCALLNELILAECISVRYMTCQRLSQLLNDLDNCEASINDVKRAKVLFLDDLGAVNLTLRKIEYIEDILKTRFEMCKYTLIGVSDKDMKRVKQYGEQFFTALSKYADAIRIG